MFIQTEATPNPSTLKFLPGELVTGSGTHEFRSIDEAAAGSPLALALFNEGGVASVLLGPDFITISKDDTHPNGRDWQSLKPLLLGAIMDHFVSRLPILFEGLGGEDAKPTGNAAANEIEQQIIDILEERVRPAVAQDGGDILFDRFEDGVVYLQMRGACAGCPSSTATLKHGVENMLRHYVPDVREVRAANA